ncbi:MAG TPA: hypothetical protein VFU43_25260 [Streptosporangiaceae bacterium]|nr:hypothetical protein [Streptosporangiaceae bacterium]
MKGDESTGYLERVTEAAELRAMADEFEVMADRLRQLADQFRAEADQAEENHANPE